MFFCCGKRKNINEVEKGTKSAQKAAGAKHVMGPKDKYAVKGQAETLRNFLRRLFI